MASERVVNRYVVRRPDGSRVTRTITERRTKSGRKVRNISGGLDNPVELRTDPNTGVTTRQDANLSEQLAAEKAANEALMEQANISLEGGGVGISTVTFTDPNAMSQEGNISLEGGGVGMVTYSQAKPKTETRGIVNFYNRVSGYIPPEERSNLTSAERVGNFFLGRQVPEEVIGGSNFDLIAPGGIFTRARFTARGVTFVNRLLGTGSKAGRSARAVSFINVQSGTTAAKIDKLVIGGVKSIGTGLAIAEGSKQVGILTTDKSIKQSIKQSGQSVREVEKQLFQAGYAAQLEQAGQASKGVKIPFTENSRLNKETILTGLNPLLGSRSAFEQGAINRGLELGLTREQSKEFAARQRRFRGFGEVGALFGLNVGTEIVGSGFVAGSRLFSKGTTFLAPKVARQKLFKSSFLNIGKAGIIEGVGDVAIMSSSRSEKLSARNVALGGAFGFASAGLLGGGIVATQAGKPLTSKGLYAVGSFLDPFEFPSDKTASLLRRAGFDKTPQPGLVKRTTRTGNELFKIGGGKSRVIVPGTFSFAPSPTAAQTPTTIKGRSNTLFGVPSVSTFNPANIFGKSSTSTSSTTNVFNPANIFGRTTSQTSTQTTVNTPSNVFIPSTVSVPRALLPPPLVPGAFPQGGRGGSGRRSKSAFADELSNALNFLGQDINKTLGSNRRRGKARRGKKR